MDTVKLTIDDHEVRVPRGTNIIEAAKSVAVEVPHYCYHPKLSVVGNCRMCLVEVGLPKRGADRNVEMGPDGKPVIAFAPKPAIGCNTTAEEGMVVRTRSPKIVEAREGVMEFLLINHPLDCPICDQAGECRLQEFAVDYGKGETRFAEEKVHKPKAVPLGPKITLDDERCIECSRCVRFMKEVAGQDCLGFVNRGSHSTLTCYPGQEPNTNYDLNIVDICPVGALTANEFRFKQRVWFLKETRSVCTSCARGCNTAVWSREGVVHRQTPRDNEAVNQCWMCDHGRLHFQFVNSPDRILRPQVSSRDAAWPEALELAARKLKAAGSVAAIGSARATLEEQYLFQKLAKKALGALHTDCVPRSGKGDGFLLREDRNPNVAGAKLTGLCDGAPGAHLKKIAQEIEAGRVKGLIVLNDNLANHGFDEKTLSKLEALVVIDTLPNAVTRLAHVVLPGATFAEKRGLLVNFEGRLQRFQAAIAPVGEAYPEWQILSGLLKALGEKGYQNLEEVFTEMTETLAPLSGLTYSKIGDAGFPLNGVPVAAVA